MRVGPEFIIMLVPLLPLLITIAWGVWVVVQLRAIRADLRALRADLARPSVDDEQPRTSIERAPS